MPSQKNNKPHARRPNSRTLLGSRVAEVIRGYAEKKSISIEDAGEKLGISRSAVFKYARKQPADDSSSEVVSLPRMEGLLQICSETGVSADWMLGFDDVPQRRQDRADVGELGEALRILLKHNSPEEHWNTCLPESSSELLSAVVRTWWTYQFTQTAKKWAHKLNALSVRMWEDSETAQDDMERTELRRIANALRRDANDFLDPMTTPWNRIKQLEEAKPLPALSNYHLREAGDPSYETRFLALGVTLDCGLAWHGTAHDDVWYIEPDTLNIRRKRKGRFLVPIEERLARERAIEERQLAEALRTLSTEDRAITSSVIRS